MKLFSFLFLGFFSLSAMPGMAQDDAESHAPRAKPGIRDTYYSDNKKRDRLDLFIDSLVKKYVASPQNSGLSIAVVKDDTVRYFNYGEAMKGVNTSTQTVYETGSVVQVFLGLLLSKAVAEKKISPSQDIRKYLCDGCTGLHYHSNPVTVQQLAFHSSGLDRVPFNLYDQKPFDSLNPFKNYTKELLQVYLSTVKPSRMPGQGVSYSVMNNVILALILEKVYGKSLAELLPEHFTEPLQLNATMLAVNGQPLNNDGRDSNGEIVPNWEFGDIVAAGGIRSTSADLAKLMRYAMGTSEEAKTNAKTFKVGSHLASYGCFVKLNSQGEKLYWQNIGTGGYSVFYGLVREQKFGVVVLSNSSMNVDYLALQIMNFYKLK